MIDLDRFLADARDKDLLVDANLLLLKVVGDVEPRWIGSRERTREYTVEDYHALERTIDAFARYFDKTVATTPNILTEVSNLLNKFSGREKALVFDRLAALVPLLDEVHIPSREAVEDDRFADFGLTDSVLLQLATRRHILLTKDKRLAALVQSRGGQVLTLAEIRALSS